MLKENFLVSKLSEIYLREIRNIPDKWLNAIENYSKYTVDWNLFIVKLLMNELYFV